MIPANHSDLVAAKWQKATLSDSGNGCVEMAKLADGRIALRNSREPNEPAHVFTRWEIECLLDGARQGEFDHLLS
jgi:hypothetical protein